MEKRMDFAIQRRESKETDTRGTCAYVDLKEEMKAIRKEWKRREVVALYSSTPGCKKIPKDLKHYFEEKPEHSGNFALRKVLFKGPIDILDDENTGRKYDISIGDFTFMYSLLIRLHLYAEDNFDYMDIEFVPSYVRRGDKKIAIDCKKKA